MYVFLIYSCLIASRGQLRIPGTPLVVWVSLIPSVGCQVLGHVKGPADGFHGSPGHGLPLLLASLVPLHGSLELPLRPGSLRSQL